MLNWSDNAYRFTIGVGSLAVGAMLAEITAAMLPIWLAMGVALFPLFLFVFFRHNELPARLVRVAHVVASAFYLMTTAGLFGAMVFAGPLPQGWPVSVVASTMGAIPCCIVLISAMRGVYHHAIADGRDRRSATSAAKSRRTCHAFRRW